MKAKEYFNQFLNENQDKSPEWRIINVFSSMVLEIKSLAKLRHVVYDAALIRIFKETEIKSYAFIRLVNETEYFKLNGILKQDAFKVFVENTSPKLASMVWQ